MAVDRVKYVADIYRYMTATQIIGGLYVGDIDDVREGDTSRFDRVVGVCQDDCSDNVGVPYEHFCLADGPDDIRGHNPGEYSYDILTDAIDTVVKARIRRETVCVHCHSAVSRSAAVCIGALAIVEGMTFEEAKERLHQTKYINPTPEMLDDVKRYIKECK